MKLVLASFLAIAAFAACGGKSKDPNTSTSNSEPGGASTGDGTPCTQEIALVCKDGEIDACLKQPPEGDTHRCVPVAPDDAAGAGDTANKCTTDGGNCVPKTATTACKTFQEGAEWGCPGDTGCCLNK